MAVTDNKNIPVIVNGGIFNLGSGGFDAKTGANIIIYGGTFNIDPSAYVAEGYNAVQADNGMWVVSAN